MKTWTEKTNWVTTSQTDRVWQWDGVALHAPWGRSRKTAPVSAHWCTSRSKADSSAVNGKWATDWWMPELLRSAEGTGVHPDHQRTDAEVRAVNNYVRDCCNTPTRVVAQMEVGWQLKTNDWSRNPHFQDCTSILKVGVWAKMRMLQDCKSLYSIRTDYKSVRSIVCSPSERVSVRTGHL